MREDLATNHHRTGVPIPSSRSCSYSGEIEEAGCHNSIKLICYLAFGWQLSDDADTSLSTFVYCTPNYTLKATFPEVHPRSKVPLLKLLGLNTSSLVEMPNVEKAACLKDSNYVPLRNFFKFPTCLAQSPC